MMLGINFFRFVSPRGDETLFIERRDSCFTCFPGKICERLLVYSKNCGDNSVKSAPSAFISLHIGEATADLRPMFC